MRRRPRSRLLLIAAAVPFIIATGTSTTSTSYDYDVFVIGGGSGGLACAKEAARLGARVGLCDFVRPSPHGTTWGIGGTCVNVGCIPKKLMHRAAQLRQILEDDAPTYGYQLDGLDGFATDGVEHDWPTLVGAVQQHVKSLNFGYRTALSDAGVTYVNARGTLAGGHNVHLAPSSPKQPARTVSARHIVLAVGGRPRVPASLARAAEGGGRVITSDDLFSLKVPPGRTLVIGGGYVALECAGFLASLGFDVTVLLRSVPLRGFDRECAERVLASVEAADPNLAASAISGVARAGLEPQAVPTAVFTPSEYACVGLSEEEARTALGDANLEVYLAEATPLEHAPVDGRSGQRLFVKLLCDKAREERLVGVHVVGEGASEIVPGYALALRLGVTKAQLDSTIGIHPTCGEELTTMRVTRRSGESLAKKGC
ncbi:thioredoxin reductase mitochondrial [Chrysochromulina tobinii]|uniref:Thioredoxin reductase mitochondrial n=1 Tax=Chrysochromulina tobinii TaxID=1460289 RepID=A0A0M0JIK6_9EUKA|nr:thioredoxin reductase mitochondrial [Chrysochromulina tobinii]|eukprot:KOO26048.1 thioredoxin reductase mitochondrial [Chrysochromulina sp. CCMP291]